MDLSDNQVRIYRNYVHKHHETIRLLEKQKREATAYVINHNLPENQFIELDRLNHEIQKTHLAHLQEIKQLCTSEQKQKFQHHLAEFIQLFR